MFKSIPIRDIHNNTYYIIDTQKFQLAELLLYENVSTNISIYNIYYKYIRELLKKIYILIKQVLIL